MHSIESVSEKDTFALLKEQNCERRFETAVCTEHQRQHLRGFIEAHFALDFLTSFSNCYKNVLSSHKRFILNKNVCLWGQRSTAACIQYV